MASLPLIAPMLATPGRLPPAAVDEQWAYEVKQDGQRAMAYLPGDGSLRLLARSGAVITPAYPDLAALGPALRGVPAVLDGEIVALDDQDRVVLLRQYRHPVGRHLWELPAGLRDADGEPPLETAKRELAEEALLAALRSGHLAGAFLDVFTMEPLPAESPFWDLPNVIVSPHSAAASDGLPECVAAIFCDNLRRFRSGEPLLNVARPVG